MEETLVTLETAKLAKDKGFNIKCYATYYDHPSMYERYTKKELKEKGLDTVKLRMNSVEICIYAGEHMSNFSGSDTPHYTRDVDYESHLKDHNTAKSNAQNYWYSAPTQSLLQKWLREVHNIHVNPRLQAFPNKYYVEISRENLPRPIFIHDENTGVGFESFEEALEAGLQEALKSIPKK